MEASIMVNSYNGIRGSINVCAAYAENQLSKLMEKVTGCMNFLNNHTDGGFFKSRLVIDTAILKRASQYKMVNGQKIEVGWMSLIQAITADRPTKLNGDRTDLLVFEEAGQWPALTKAFTNADALVGLVGRLWGIRLLGGKLAGIFI